MTRLSTIMVIFVAIITMIGAWPLAWTPLSAEVNKLASPAELASKQVKPELNGTLWRGEIKGVNPFGNIRFVFTPIKKLKGESLLSFSSNSRAITSRGQADMSGVNAVTAKGDLAWILPKDQRFGGIQGGFDLALQDLSFNLKNIEEGCLSADGFFTTDVLKRNQRIWFWQGPNLSGPIWCENGQLVTELSGAEAGQNIQIRVEMLANGIYTATVQVETHTIGADAVLTLYGFTKSGRSYSLNETGKWR